MGIHLFFATDGSVSSRFAQAQIVSIPWRPPVHVTAMTAVEVPHPPFTSLLPAARRAYDTALSALREDAEANANDVLDKARRELEPHFDTVATRMHAGYAGATIVEMAAACRADLVVVGSRGLGPYKGLLLGSVSNHVAQCAGCSVLVAKPPPKERRRLLTALEGTVDDRRVVGWLGALDLSASARIHFLQVRRRREASAASGDSFLAWANSSEALQIAGCHGRGVEATAEVRHGQEVPEILDAVFRFRPELLLLGATAWQSTPGAPLSKAAWKLLNHAPCSTVIVRP